jgi:hypothetical protein
MRYIPLARVSEYYHLATIARLQWRTADDFDLDRFCQVVGKLTRLGREQDDDTGWREFLYPAWRARKVFTTVPLPFSDPLNGVRQLMKQLEDAMRPLGVYGGDNAAELGASVVELGLRLLRCDEAPLADAVAELAETEVHGSTGLLLPMAEYAEPVRRFLASRQRCEAIEVLRVQDLPAAEPMARLVVIGPLFWYRDHEHVLTSPRAIETTVLNWAWYREGVPRLSVLEGSSGGAGLRTQPAPHPRSDYQGAEGENPPSDWGSIDRELAGSGDADLSEPVPARSTVLANGYAVLLPEDEDRPVWILDPHAPPDHRVVRVNITDLEPGHVIVLRTAGGGDLIVPLADEILGSSAPRLRELQHQWKANLGAWVRIQGGISSAAAALRRAGCKIANRQNLQNWLSERSLRTDDRGDWQILMDMASLGPEASALWLAMEKLENAHRKAGKSVGQRLREMAGTEPLDALLATGQQVFALSAGGSLTAFRIDGFAPEATMCVPARLLVPAKVRGEWLN